MASFCCCGLETKASVSIIVNNHAAVADGATPAEWPFPTTTQQSNGHHLSTATQTRAQTTATATGTGEDRGRIGTRARTTGNGDERQAVVDAGGVLGLRGQGRHIGWIPGRTLYGWRCTSLDKGNCRLDLTYKGALWQRVCSRCNSQTTRIVRVCDSQSRRNAENRFQSAGRMRCRCARRKCKVEKKKGAA